MPRSIPDAFHAYYSHMSCNEDGKASKALTHELGPALDEFLVTPHTDAEWLEFNTHLGKAFAEAITVGRPTGEPNLGRITHALRAMVQGPPQAL